MYLADYHTHSSVSHDGRMTMAELAEAYIAAVEAVTAEDVVQLYREGK